MLWPDLHGDDADSALRGDENRRQPAFELFQKQLTQRSANPVFIIAVVHATLTAMCLPLLLVRGTLAIAPGPEVWVNMVICALLAVAGNVLLVHAVKAVDLSVLGPINAYKSVVGLVLGIFLIGERPTAMGVAGTLLIVAGSYFVVDDPVDEPRRHAFVRFFRERGSSCASPPWDCPRRRRSS